MSYSIANKRENTVKSDKRIIQKLKKVLLNLNITNISDITPKYLEDYKTNRINVLNPTSLNREIDCIKALFNKATEWNYISNNPAKHLKSLKKPIKQPRFLNSYEVKLLLNNSEQHIKHMIMIGIYTGFRISEVFNLQWKDINFEAETISVNPKHNFTPKSYEFRTIPLNKILKEYLFNLSKDKQLNDYLFNEYFKRLDCVFMQLKKTFSKCKIKQATFHTLRHTFAN